MLNKTVNELKAQYQKAHTPAWIWDPDFKRIFWGNQRAASFWGEPSAATLLDRWFDPSSETTNALGAIATGSTGGETTQTHIPLFYQGAIARLACDITAIKFKDGRRGLFIALVMPITVAPDTADKAFDITDVLPQVIATFSAQGHLLHQNAIAKDVFGSFHTATGDGAPVALSYWLGGEHLARQFVAIVMASAEHSVLQNVQTRFGQRIYRIHAKRLDQTRPSSPAFVVTFMDAGSQAGHNHTSAANEPAHTVVSIPVAIADTSPAAEIKYEAAKADAMAIDAGANKPAPADFTWKMDRRSRLIEIGSGISQFIGISHKDLLGRTWINISDEYALDFDGAIENLIDTRKAWCATVIWPVKQGIKLVAVEIEFSAEPVTTAEGKFLGFMGTGRAVNTEPKAADTPASDDVIRPSPSSMELTWEEEQAFRDLGHELSLPQDEDVNFADQEPEKHFVRAESDFISALELALDDAPICYLVHRNFHILYVNKSAASLFGFNNVEDLIGDPNLLNLFPGERARLFDWQTKFDDEVAGVGQAERTLELTGSKADKTDVLISSTLAPIDVDDGYAVQMILSERTAQTAKVISEELLAANAREAELRTILDTATDGIATLDAEGRVVSLNKSAEAIFGRNHKDVEGIKFVDLLSEDSRITVNDYLNGLTDSNIATIFNDGREIIAVEKKGGHVPLFLTVGKMPEGNPSKFCAVMRDMTQWKKAEDNLKQAIEVAERASTQKSEFLAKISHELRTPLNSIIGFSEVMAQEQFGELKNDRYRGYINDIHSSGIHLLSLINDLLDLSKVEAGKLELKFASVDLNEIILKSVSAMQNDAKQARIVIRNSLNSDLPNVVADERSCRQIILNLLSNAIKFTKSGGQVIVSTTLEKNGDVKISVRDTGIGMSKKEISYALEPFRQITTSSTGNAVGTGLGLPLTKALTEANKARFTIESKPKSGTLIEIIFPTARVLAE